MNAASATHPAPPVPPSRLGQFWQDWRRRLTIGALTLLALAPAAYMLSEAAEASRDVVYWDEFETALALILKLKEGTTPGEFFAELFSLNNEHRMVTSRLLFATSYWLTGTVNFTVVSLIGNASIVALCVVLLVAAGTAERRLRLGLPLVALLFQMQHYENFLWSGSSIDHFQVVLLAAAALVGLGRGTLRGVLIGGVLAGAATFTLAHGLLIWPVGALLLAATRRWRDLAVWCGLGALAGGVFFSGFTANQSHRFAEQSLGGALTVGRYWLALLGAVPALGHAALAPVLGGALLLGLGLLALGGALRREPVALLLALYAVAAAALIAIGRAEESRGVMFSRYYVLSAVAWALAAFMLLERFSDPRRPLRPLLAALPLLAAFNLTANELFSDKADAWIECRDRAVTRFKQHGVDGLGPFTLHPTPARATDLLRRAEALGVYRMGPICLRRPFLPDAKPSTRMAYFVDEMTVSSRSAYVSGWAALPGEPSRRGEMHVVLRSDKETYMYTAVTVTRPDVAQATGRPEWEFAGFRFARRRDRLPTGEFQLGFLITNAGKEEYIMTAHRLRLIGEGEALLAKGD
ncbi:MAG: hypothetical protein Q8N18_01535 [Opitutaceae bacterium]|nr:hypothetical protein [Opitutaceae bacterium]